jgi:DNA-binding NarL/FixJ family response regulator
MTADDVATGVAREVTPADSWDVHRQALADCRDAIEEAEEQLQEAYSERGAAVIDAWDDGMPQREIGWELGISHTMVQKIIAGELDVEPR